MQFQIKKILLFLVLILLQLGVVQAEKIIKWELGPHRLDQYPKKDITITLSFDGAFFAPAPKTPLPYYYFEWPTQYSQKGIAKLRVDSIAYRQALPWEAAILSKYEFAISEDFDFITEVNEFRGKYLVKENVLPIRKSKDGGYELLTFYSAHRSIVEQATVETSATKGKIKEKSNQSMLSYGKTLKIGVEQSGIYKVSFEDLSRQGLLSRPIPSSQISLYGNSPGMLPTINQEDIYDDLSSLPIELNDKGDGVFGPGDYFIFYGQSPVLWQINNDGSAYTHIQHSYTDKTFYFVGVNHPANPARIQNSEIQQEHLSQNSKAATVISTFTDFLCYEKELTNLTNGGQNWYGESFNSSGEKQNFFLNLNDISQAELFNATDNVKLKIKAAGITQHGEGNIQVTVGENSFPITLPPSLGSNVPIDGVRISQADITKYLNVKSSTFTVSCSYSKTGDATKANIDFIEVNFKRNLRLNRGEVIFRNPLSAKTLSTFEVSAASATTQVWDVSDPYNSNRINSAFENGTVSFSAGGDGVLREYVAFDGSSFRTPAYIGLTDTQNIHSYAGIEYVVVCPDEFMDQAKKIAEIHSERNDYSTLAISTTKIYNEFSTSVPDPSAIRMFMKMLYDKAQNGQYSAPRYLLLLGKASFDVKNRMGKNTCLIPTYEVLISSNDDDPVTDDIFAYMGDEEGLVPSQSGQYYTEIGAMDIAVGRLPVRNIAEANDAIEKIDIYSDFLYSRLDGWGQKTGNLGDWRNDITFITDDGFESQYESSRYDFTNEVLRSNPNINIEKIYADAFVKESSAVSSSFPQSTAEFKSRMNKGGLFVGYIGHSGWDAWGDEKYLTINDIHQWEPSLALPMMFASSCTFSYYDQVDRLSGGEETVLHPGGGAISMIASSRKASSGGQIEFIQKDFIVAAVGRENGKRRSIGDAFLYAKNKNKPSSVSIFVLLGDPGLKVNLPMYNVKTLTINGKSIEEKLDTLKAFSKMEITGEIEDNGVKLNDFNGILQVKVFDKVSTAITRGNSQGRGQENNPKVEYNIQKNIIYKGSVNVVNGNFKFSFIVPKDIAYNYGAGKISYYAYSDTSGDAGGSYTGITVGGFSNDVLPDTTAPLVKLHINKDNFLNDAFCGTAPILYAEISDKNGLNTTGAGIGHDMTLVIDGDYKNAVVLNDLFTYNTNSYSEGSLTYPLTLSPGEHKIELKVWNIFNISGKGDIGFGINNSDKFEITEFRIAPNPCKREDDINFSFTHNGVGGIDRYEIQVYDLYGGRVATLEGKESSTYGYSVGPLTWNTAKNKKETLQRGVYVVRLVAYNKAGEMSTSNGKLVVAY